MRRILLSICLCPLLLGLAPAHAADDCRTVRAPGGGYMTECGSQAPKIPAAEVDSAVPRVSESPVFYARCVIDSRNACDTQFSNRVAPGTDCMCKGRNGVEMWGTTVPSR
jgi:hypothetical protein